MNLTTLTTKDWHARAAGVRYETRHFIDGQYVDSVARGRFTVVNPATGAPLCEVSAGTAADIDVAVASAKRSFASRVWSRKAPRDRMAVMAAYSQLLEENVEKFSLLDTLCMGKPITDMVTIDVPSAARNFAYFGELIDKMDGTVTATAADAFHYILREPLGVVGCIVPWNYPLLMAAWKLAPAIAAGCTCVLKPAEQTPLTALEFAGYLADAGLPPGVVNIITGFGEECGTPLVKHPDVNKVAFTGSASVGKAIMKAAADTVKRVTLELGGKSPNIFFADADFESAIDGALFGVFINQGEVCSAGSRILVEKSIYPKFVEAMSAKAKTIRLGPPLERETKMGPLVSKDQFDRVRSYQELGKKEAKLAAGGGRPASMKQGYYVEPTIFYDVDNSARIAQEEIFGPVAAVIPFADEAEALRIANATPYGLAAAIWSRDIFKALRMVKALRAGIVWVNHMQPTYVEAPWGGYKQSGFGRELGPWGIEEYLETKQVHINLNEQPIGWY